MSEIFISYAREDREFARELAVSLEQEGWSVWWDRSIPTGRRYHRVIEDALAAARCVIVVWSQHSVDSDWVRAEAGEGMARNVLAPVAIDAARPPLVFRQLQTADLSGWRGDNAAAEFQKLVRDIAAIAAPRETPAAAAAPAAGATAETPPDAGEERSRPAPPGDASDRPGTASERPRVVRFYAFPRYVELGRNTTLTWSVKDADRIVIEGCGEQPPAGTLEVLPEEDVSYRLVATNSAGRADAEVKIRVRPGADRGR